LQPQPQRILRVGSVPFLVARPLDAELEREPLVRLSRDVPSRLVERLRAGELDVALVSSIELFRRPGYGYLAGSAIAGDGFVPSVQVFLRRPLAELRTVALDPSSRTAQALAQVMLARRAAGRGVPAPKCFELEAGADPSLAPADAWLEIGDAALRRSLSPAAPPTFNPSQAWSEDLGLPFVFAAWITRPGLQPTDAERSLFARARARGTTRERLRTLAREAAARWEVDGNACERYLSLECRFDPGAQLEPALLAFRDAAAALGLCRGDLRPQAFAPAVEPAGNEPPSGEPRVAHARET
jgi:chorismate dehydratase